jgi:hypothetical protein
MINGLKNHLSNAPRRFSHRAKGWTAARRAHQAALIRRWQLWRRSTGPTSDAGKARCAANALKHGRRSREWLYTARRARHTLRLAGGNLTAIRAFLRASRKATQPQLLAPTTAAGSVANTGRRAHRRRARTRGDGRNSP